MNEPTMGTNEKQKEGVPLRTKIFGFTVILAALALLGLLMWGVLAGTSYVFGIPDKVILAVILAVVAWEGLKEIEFRRAQNKEAHRNLAAHIERLEETIKKVQAEHLPRRVARLEHLTEHGSGLWPPSEGFKEYMRDHFKRQEREKKQAEIDGPLMTKLDQETAAVEKEYIAKLHEDASYWLGEQLEDEDDLEDESL